MTNPHLDNLTLADRLIAFVIWSVAGFIAGIVALPLLVLEGVGVALAIGIACGIVGAIWPRAISSLIKGIWHS